MKILDIRIKNITYIFYIKRRNISTKIIHMRL